MKILGCLIVLSCFTSSLFGQIFHFNEHSTTLVKTTDQSPAHWYIEIFTDISVDSTLRWKAFFQSIPNEWQISLDDQTNYTTNISDGDSSDFTLFSGLPYAQKLIIGATLNDQPGIGSVFFDIFDPEFPEYRDTIEFRFIISSVGLNELINAGIVTFENSIIHKTTDEPTSLQVVDLSGRKLVDIADFHSFDCSSLPPGEVLLISIQRGEKRYLMKWMR